MSAVAATSSSTSRSPTGSPAAQVAILSISLASAREVVADELHERGAGVGLGLDARLPEALGDPCCRPRLATSYTSRPVAHAFASGASFFTSRPTSASTVSGAGAAEVGDDRLDVGGLPAVAELALGVGPAVDVVDDDETPVTEQAARIAERDDVGARRLERGDALDRLGHEMRAQPCDGRLDLRAVAAGDQVGGLQLDVGHTRTLPRTINASVSRAGCEATRSVRPSVSTTTRPSVSVR